jgi:sulfopyruvate decarboxylase subunit beta
MKRIEAIDAIAKAAGDALIICNLGFPSRELYAVADRPENFYMLGSMGLASSIGLGLALSLPSHRVIVLDGDGSVLMNLGSLATIANRSRDNYLLVILDNGCYGSTGSQPTCTSMETNLAHIAKACGVLKVKTVDNIEDLANSVSGKGVIVVNVEMENADVPIIDIPPAQILRRFRQSFL